MSLTKQWRAEKASAWLYRAVARAESDSTRRTLFEQLGDAAEVQAGLIADKLREEDRSPPDFVPSRRAHVVAWLVGRLGPRRMLPALAAMKIRGLSVYAAGSPLAEHAIPRSVDDFGHRHRQYSGFLNLRAAVFGVNDGLVSNASLIMGVAGASSDTTAVFISGVAGMLAGAFSMGAGEYVSVRTQRELYEYQIGLEREELELYPAEEAEELSLIYNARGVPLERAREMARLVFEDDERALKTLAIEELGLNPDELGSPWVASLSSFLAFTLGAMVPVAPLLVTSGGLAVALAAGLSALGLFVVGGASSLLTGRRAVYGGLRMLAIGGGAGLLTYAIGSALGVALA